MSFGYRVLGFGQSEISLFPQENFALSDELLVDGENALDVIGFALDRHNRGKGAIAWRDGTNIRVKVFTSTTANVITLGSTQTLALGANFRGDQDQLAFCGSNKFVLGYIKNGDNQNSTTNASCVICTISGTTVTFGSETVIRGAYSNGLQIAADQQVDDRIAAQFVTVDGGGYRTKVVAATISGTTPSFSGMTQLTGDNGDSQDIDYVNGRCISTFKDHQNGYDGYATAFSISGNSISAGSNVQYDDILHAKNAKVRINPNNANEAIVTNLNKSTNAPQLKIATISGTSMSFGNFITVDDKNVDSAEVRFNKNFEDRILSVYTDEDADAGDPGRAKIKAGLIDGSGITFGDEQSLASSQSGHGTMLEFDQHADGADKFFYLYRSDTGNDTAIRIGQMGGRS
tara:strand:+ start:510 stop:1715 length:1206 start_codon:yes stop_codon:yes gene_type:complete